MDNITDAILQRHGHLLQCVPRAIHGERRAANERLQALTLRAGDARDLFIALERRWIEGCPEVGSLGRIGCQQRHGTEPLLDSTIVYLIRSARAQFLADWLRARKQRAFRLELWALFKADRRWVENARPIIFR